MVFLLSKKILILLEHLRVEHTIQHRDGSMTVDFLSSGMGALLKRKLKGAGIDMSNVDVEYVYPTIPEPKSIDNKTKKPISYKDVPMKEFNKRYPDLDRFIVSKGYDMVIPTGRMGCKYLLNQVSITKLQGVPEEKSIELETGEKHDFWVFPMFSMEYIDFKKNAELLYDASLNTLKTFLDEGDTAFQPSEVTYDYLDTMEAIRNYFKFIKDNKLVTAWDLETNTLRADMPGAKPIVISISHAENQGVTIPLEHKEHQWEEEELEEIKGLIRDYVADPELIKVLQGGRYDIRFLMLVYGFKEFEKNLDTKVAYYLTVSQEETKSFKLTDLAYEMTDMGGYDKPLEEWKANYIKEYGAEHKKNPVNDVDGSNFSYEWFPLKDVLAPYASGDVDATLRIHNNLMERINTSQKWVDLYFNFYPRLIVALAQAEANGLQADIDYLNNLKEVYPQELERIIEAIRKTPQVQQLEEENRELYEIGLKEWAKPKAERDPELAKLRDKYKKKLEFNPKSPDDKGRLLFDIIGARPPVNKETVKDSASNKSEHEIEWTDYKTDKNMIAWIHENLKGYEELTELLTQYSQVSTLMSTFVTGLSNAVNPITNRVHGTFNETGTATSRLSSSSPNLQNIPKSHQEVDKFDYKYPIKRIFTSRFDGGAILQADYSALEMRILGLIAKDPGMTEAFLEGKDLHKNTASIVFGKPEEEISKDERDASKSIAFGIIYGEQPFSLAPKLGISVPEAEELFDKFFKEKPQIKQFIEDTHKFLDDNGFVETMQGHRRILRDVWGNKQAKSGAYRQSVNTIIQGTGAYLTNFSVILIQDYLRTRNKESKLVATVHDSIVIDMHPDEIEEITQITKLIMENLPIDFLNFERGGQVIRYPITADVEIGSSYKDLVDYDPELFKQFRTAKGYINYLKDKSTLQDYFASKKINEEQLEEGIRIIDSQLEAYKQQ